MNHVLITTANGMFGSAVTQHLLKKGVHIRLVVRDRTKCRINDPGAEIVTADFDNPETIDPVMKDIDSVFLATPIDPRLAERETAIIDAACRAGVKRIVRIAGTVVHTDDPLEKVHKQAINVLKHSGIPYVLISPGSVMETSLIPMAGSIKFMHALYGISGHAKVCLVALKDIAEVTAHVMITEGHEGKEYRLSGPEAIDLYELAERFSGVIGEKISYIDLSEEKFIQMLTKFDKKKTREQLEMEVLCHLRAWKRGNASLITDTFEQISGRKATPVDEFIRENLGTFHRGMVPGMVAWLMRKTI